MKTNRKKSLSKLVKVGQKVIDRWYSYHTSSPQGVGKILTISKNRRYFVIKFAKLSEPLTYDSTHVNEFLLIHSKKYAYMAKKHNGYVKK